MGWNGARWYGRWGGLVASSLLVVGSASAADRSDYCNKTHARAVGDAAILIAPRLVVNALRFPGTGVIDVGPTLGSNTQVRVGGSLAPLDIARGAQLLSVSEADCRAHEAGERIRQVLETALDAPELPAYRAELAFLEARQSEWARMFERADERLAAHVINLADLNEFRRLVDALNRKLARARSAVRRLEVRSLDLPSERMDTIEKEYVAANRDFEQRSSDAKQLDPWGFKVTAAAIPAPGGVVDWAGWVDLSYSLGGPVRSIEERAYLAARAAEMRNAPYEATQKIAELKRRLDAEIEATQSELSMVSKQLEVIEKTRSSFATATVARTEFAQDSLAVEQISAEADRIHLSTLLSSLNATRGGDHGSP